MKVGASNNRRLALVVGNSAYPSAALKNPVNDANDMATILEKIGFEVIIELDADYRTLVSAIQKFGKNLHAAEIGLFYYAGHGLQIDGVNYLVPVNARCESAADVEFETVKADRLLSQMEQAGSKLNIVILDACRDNPFRSFRSLDKGLAQMYAPKGSIVAYATAPGSVAADGTGRNGLYTSHLLKNIQNPDLTVIDMFRETGLGVMKESGDKQIPWTSSTPVKRFYLASYRVKTDTPSADAKDRATLIVKSNVTGASVLLDGSNVGKTPLKGMPVSPGNHRIQVSKSGYESYRQTIELVAGRSIFLDAKLNSDASQKGLPNNESSFLRQDALFRVIGSDNGDQYVEKIEHHLQQKLIASNKIDTLSTGAAYEIHFKNVHIGKEGPNSSTGKYTYFVKLTAKIVDPKTDKTVFEIDEKASEDGRHTNAIGILDSLFKSIATKIAQQLT